MCYEAARRPNGRYYRNNGVWRDQLRRSGDGWVFTHPHLLVPMARPVPFTGDTFMSLPPAPVQDSPGGDTIRAAGLSGEAGRGGPGPLGHHVVVG